MAEAAGRICQFLVGKIEQEECCHRIAVNADVHEMIAQTAIIVKSIGKHVAASEMKYGVFPS